MRMTPKVLRARENLIFDRLERDRVFRNRLYRDGVPSPRSYFAQRVRVVFVFREPSMADGAWSEDMRDSVSDPQFRPVGPDGTRQERRPSCFWNAKAGMYAHAVGAVFDGESATRAFKRFETEEWHHDVVNRFAYIQIKKVGGGGVSRPQEICEHAAKYAAILKAQIQLYQPHLVLGCGIGSHSPARLLALHVLTGGRKAVMSTTNATWWEFPVKARPRALLQLWHPSWRGESLTLYKDVWESVFEVANAVGLMPERDERKSSKLHSSER